MNYIQTYTEAIEFLESLTNLTDKEFYSPEEANNIYHKRMGILLEMLDNPHQKLEFIHIGGTNGKGSTTTMIHNILSEAGHTVGSYTSPHLTAFIERISVNGLFISPDQVVKMVQKIKPILEEYYLKSPYPGLSYREVTLALAFTYFVESQCDYVVLEVGCGGNNDQTNIIPPPLVSIVTNIGHDHLDIIGPTLKDVAIEKSGIIKKNGFFITQEKDPEHQNIFKEQCNKTNSTYNKISEEYDIITQDENGSKFKFGNITYSLHLPGTHQIENAITAITATQHLNIETKAIQNGLQKTQFAGRFEIMQKEPLVILDVAHNPEKLQTTINVLQKIKSDGNYNKVWMIYGAASRKELQSIMPIIIPEIDEILVSRHAFSFRKAANPYDIIQEIKKVNPDLNPQYFLIAHEALEYVLQNAQKNDIILITGSVYMPGLLREKWFPKNYILENRTLL